MKTTLALLSLAVFAAILAPAMAPAAENGITLFAIGPVALDNGAAVVASSDRWEGSYMEGASAGGLREDREVHNGITDFGSKLPVGTYEEGPEMESHNGITLFSTEP